MIGIVIPAHNEESCLAECLEAAQTAAASPSLMGEPVVIVVVLDSCTDGSADLALACSVTTVSIGARNVGQARAAGADFLIGLGARWLAFTDADTHVSPEWLACQLALETDAVCGSIGILDWSGHASEVRERYESLYRDEDGHRHVHGANLGVSRNAYLAAGGFPALAVSEDVALVRALEEIGCRISWSAAPRVATSARWTARAAGGFSDFIKSLYSPTQGPEAQPV